MAQTIQIKRTTGTGKPTNVAAGELFYAYGSNGTYGKRLAIGHTDGGTNNPEIIGGSHFMDMLTVTPGTLTADKAIVTDSNNYIDDLQIKNQGGVKLYELTAQGSSYTTVRSAAALAGNITYTLPAAPTNGYVLQTNGSGDLSWVAAGGTLTVGADSGVDDAVDLITDSLTFEGTANEIETTVSDNKITIGFPTNVTISGDLTVSGNTTTVNTSTLAVEDPLLSLATGNNGSDAVDIGFYGLYDNGADKYAGLFRDASDGKFKLFKELAIADAPGTTVDITGTGYAVATLVAAIESSSATITGGSVTGITDLVVADGGTGRGTFTTNGVLYGNGTTGLLATAAGTTGQIMYSNAGVPAWTDGVDGGTYS